MSSVGIGFACTGAHSRNVSQGWMLLPDKSLLQCDKTNMPPEPELGVHITLNRLKCPWPYHVTESTARSLTVESTSHSRQETYFLRALLPCCFRRQVGSLSAMRAMQNRQSELWKQSGLWRDRCRPEFGNSLVPSRIPLEPVHPCGVEANCFNHIPRMLR